LFQTILSPSCRRLSEHAAPSMKALKTILKLITIVALAEAFESPASVLKKTVNNAVSAAAPAVVAGTLAATLAVAPALAGDAAAGVSVFSGNCAACHAGGRNVIMPLKTLQQDALEEYLDGGATEKAVVKQVTNGKNAMPAFGGRLSDDDIANVAAYVIATAKAGWD